MNLYRSKTFEIQIQKPDGNRAFVFDVEVGIGKAGSVVDPMSGMLLNLVDLDAAMAELRQFWLSKSWSSLQALLIDSRDFLATLFLRHGCFLQELCLREKRGYWLGWTQTSQLFMGREEIHELSGRVFCLRWQKALKEADLENLKISIAPQEVSLGWEQFFEKRTELQLLQIEDLGRGEKWSIAR